MHATARVAASAGGRLDVLYGEAPLLPRRTGPNEIHFVSGAAGPLGGDRLRIEVCVGAGATLTVRSVAAMIALPSRDGALSRLDVHATVEDGGRLEWLTEPLIAAGRCNHVTASTVDLAVGASLVWRDELVCGRHGETPGDVRLLTSVQLDKRSLYVHELAVGPSAPGWSGPAVLAGGRVHSTTVLVDPRQVDQGEARRNLSDSRARLSLIDSVGEGAAEVAAMRLGGGALLVTAVGKSLRAVREAAAG
jgi:urease accessory protein